MESLRKSIVGQKHTPWRNGFGTVLPVSKPHATYSQLPLIKEINVSVMGFRCCRSSYQEDFHSSFSWISSVEQRMPLLAQLHVVFLLMQPKRGTRAVAFPSNLEQVSAPERAASGPKKVRLILSAESSWQEQRCQRLCVNLPNVAVRRVNYTLFLPLGFLQCVSPSHGSLTF